jgi:hypothetical protein
MWRLCSRIPHAFSFLPEKHGPVIFWQFRDLLFSSDSFAAQPTLSRSHDAQQRFAASSCGCTGTSSLQRGLRILRLPAALPSGPLPNQSEV